MKSTSERRIEPRIPVRIHMRYRLIFSPDGTPAEPELHNGNNLVFNISRGGFFLSTKNYFELGTILQVEFPLEIVPSVVTGNATLVRVNNYNFPNQGRYEYGFQFKDLATGCVEALDRFIKMTK